MKRALSLVLLPLLGGCGGNPIGTNASYSLTPSRATVAMGGSVDLRAEAVEIGYSDLQASVREGAAGGTLVLTPAPSPETGVGGTPDGAVYTAPSSPGTYHVDVRFLSGAKVLATRTATIAVDVAP